MAAWAAGIRHYQISGREAGHTGAKLQHLARKLMARRHRQPRDPLPGLEVVEIGSADARRAHPQPHFSRARRRRRRHALDAEIADAMEPHRAHRQVRYRFSAFSRISDTALAWPSKPS